ncbi:hypothetical protein Ancab_008055 [Ancistrocladus abbreviatus]
MELLMLTSHIRKSHLQAKGVQACGNLCLPIHFPLEEDSKIKEAEASNLSHLSLPFPSWFCIFMFACKMKGLKQAMLGSFNLDTFLSTREQWQAGAWTKH